MSKIIAYFDLSGIKILFFDLGLDIDDYPDEGKPGYVRQLILQMERLGRMSELKTLVYSTD